MFHGKNRSMARQYYSKRHYEMVSPRASTQEEIKERVAQRECAGQANKEMVERFAPLTPEKVNEATEWQNQRINELMRAKGFKGY